MNKNWRCPSGQTFFGLTDKYSESVYDQIFLLKYHGGWSFIEVYNLPIGLRRWFLGRLEKQFKIWTAILNAHTTIQNAYITS